MTMRRILLALLVTVGAAALVAPIVAADPFTEPAFYNGRLVHFLLPSAGSADPNEQVVANCFRVGPQVPASVPVTAKVYILLIPGASQETRCSTDGRPAGPLSHNHVFSAAPGDPGYNAHFILVLVGPGPSYPGAAFADTYTSQAAVLAGIAVGQLVILNPDAAHTHWSLKV
jgi:hypothetical protein